MKRGVARAAVAVAVAVAVLAVPYMFPTFIVSLLSLVFIAALLASSVNMLAGRAGLVSIGHAGIAATASYAVAWATLRDVGVAGRLGLALALVLLVSVVFAATTARTSGIVFLMITLALGMMVFGLAFKLSGITGGQNGLTGVARPAFVAAHWKFYYLTAAVLVLSLGALAVLSRSPFGLMLKGVRDSEMRMSSLGYSVPAAKFAGVVMSGLFAGIAGVLGVWHSQFVSPSAASFARSAMVVVMVILGGAGTLLGPVVGATIAIGTEHWVSSYVSRWPTLLGVLFIAVVIFVPRGLVGAVEDVAHRRRTAARGRSERVQEEPELPTA